MSGHQRYAVTIHRFGGPEVLAYEPLPMPEPGQRELLIRVHAAAVNPADTLLRAGRLPMSPEEPPPWVPGLELAGVVAATGPGTHTQIDERVVAILPPLRRGGGAQADHVVVPEDWTAHIPDGLGAVAASTLPMTGLTAWRAIDVLDLPPGSTLAVTGAAGVLGGHAVALASRRGLRVIADAGPTDDPAVRRLGATEVVERGPDVAERIRRRAPQGVDGLVDASVQGGEVYRAVRDGGHIAVMRSEHDPGDPGRDIRRTLIRSTDMLGRRDVLDDLLRRAVSGHLELRIADTLPAEEVASAHRRLARGGLRGRLVLTFSGGGVR